MLLATIFVFTKLCLVATSFHGSIKVLFLCESQHRPVQSSKFLSTKPKATFNFAAHLRFSNTVSILWLKVCASNNFMAILQTTCLPSSISESTRKCLHGSYFSFKLSTSTFPTICVTSTFFGLRYILCVVHLLFV